MTCTLFGRQVSDGGIIVDIGIFQLSAVPDGHGSYEANLAGPTGTRIYHRTVPNVKMACEYLEASAKRVIGETLSLVNPPTTYPPQLIAEQLSRVSNADMRITDTIGNSESRLSNEEMNVLISVANAQREILGAMLGTKLEPLALMPLK